jgi:putative transposase
MKKHHRRSIRLPDYDYSQAGVYYVTLVTKDRIRLFGDIVQGEMVLSDAGDILKQEWEQTAAVRENVELDGYVIMPNHIHGILIITENMDGDVGANRRVGASRRLAPTDRPTGAAAGSLGAILGQIKSITTKRINAMRNSPGAAVWQRNYYEHIIRCQGELDRIRQYIELNPVQWETDREHC